MLALYLHRSVHMSSENSIVKEVRESYVRDKRIPHPAEIAVAERHGNLTLRGTLGSLNQIHAAAQIAKSATRSRGGPQRALARSAGSLA